MFNQIFLFKCIIPESLNKINLGLFSTTVKLNHILNQIEKECYDIGTFMNY